MEENPRSTLSGSHPAVPPEGEKPLQSWKEIGAYLDRDSRTARRWEKTLGLPVRRHGDSSRASVYAYPSELDAWRAARPPKTEAETPTPAWRRLSPALAVMAMILLAALVVLQGPILSPSDPLAEAADKTGLAIRLVLDDPEGDVLGTISADGRYLSCSDWDTGNAGICDLSTGEKRALTQYGNWGDEDAWKKSGFTDLNIISPDGKQIAFTYYTSSREPNPTVELRVINSDGTGQRTLYSKSPYTNDGWIIPYAWSSDGEHILAGVQVPGEVVGSASRGHGALVLVAVEDGSLVTLRDLKSTRRYRNRRPFLSHDKRYVAYDFPPNQEVADGDVFILPVESREPIPVSPHPADDYALGWTPDGETLLFASNRSGSFGIWSIAVEDGKPQGKPELLRPHVGKITPAGFDDGGTLYYTLKSEPTNAHLASIDLQTGKVTGQPQLLTNRFSGSNDWAAWSSDGNQIAYRSWQGPSDQSSMRISIRSVETGGERDLVPQLAEFSRLRWHADGRSLLVMGRPHTEPTLGLYRVDAQTGETTLLLAEATFEITDWTKNGEEVILRLRKPSRFVKRNLKGGSDRVVYELPEDYRRMFSGGLSPDGTMLAVAQFRAARRDGGSLTMVSTATGEPREVYQFEKGHFMQSENGFFVWSPDSRFVYMVIRGEGRILQVPVDGGETVETGLIRGVWSGELSEEELDTRRISALSVSPDGKQISLSVQEKAEFGLWAMENFLPQLTQSEQE